MSIESENNNKIINFPTNKIVRTINNEKPKGFHQKRVEELLWQLEYEFMKGYDAGEFAQNKEFQYHKILPLQREDKKLTKFMVVIYPTEFPM